MDLSSVKPLETKEVDVTRFLKLNQEEGDPERAVFLIKHYTTWEKNEFTKMLTGAKLNDEGKVEIDSIPDMNKVMVKQLLSGVYKSPFTKEKWDEPFIKKLDSMSPTLIGFLLEEVNKYNAPLEKATSEKSPE